MQRIKLVLAFDHELALGGVDSYAHNLFEPTDALLELASSLGVPIVLFTDVLCAIKHEEWAVESFSAPYRRQIECAIKASHDVQLHIHPHWADSEWAGGTFVPSRHFALSDFKDRPAPDDIRGLITRSATYLRRLCLPADPSYECIAFRAGGYNLASETGTILAALFENGIRIDSSIIPGYNFASRLSKVDFRRVPQQANWFVPLSGPIDECGEPGLFEIPIASAPRTPFNNMPFLARRVLHRRRQHRSGGRSIHDDNTAIGSRLKRLFPSSAWPLSFDHHATSAKGILRILRRHVAAHSDEPEILCASVSHPKSMGTYARKLMSEFITRARDEFGDRLEFCDFQSIYRELSHGASEQFKATS